MKPTIINKLIPLIIFGVAFAFIEAAVVFYLRKLLGYVDFPNSSSQTLLNLGAIAFTSPDESPLKDALINRIEITRELSTILVLFSFALVSGKNLKQRFGSFLISFALWDIFYYIFLKLLADWPKTIFDIDVYFLIPTPSVGPVITPLVVSGLLIILGINLFLNNQDIKNQV